MDCTGRNKIVGFLTLDRNGLWLMTVAIYLSFFFLILVLFVLSRLDIPSFNIFFLFLNIAMMSNSTCHENTLNIYFSSHCA